MRGLRRVLRGAVVAAGLLVAPVWAGYVQDGAFDIPGDNPATPWTASPAVEFDGFVPFWEIDLGAGTYQIEQAVGPLVTGRSYDLAFDLSVSSAPGESDWFRVRLGANVYPVWTNHHVADPSLSTRMTLPVTAPGGGAQTLRFEATFDGIGNATGTGGWTLISLDNVSLLDGVLATVPLPSSLWLAAGGLALVRGRRRRA